MKSYYYSQKLSVTDSQQSFDLPLLRSVTIINIGDYDVMIEFENDIDDNSIIIPVGSNIVFPFSPLNLKYKCQSGQTATIYLTGLRHEKL